MLKTAPVETTTPVVSLARPTTGFSLLWSGLAVVTVGYAALTVGPFLSDLVGGGTSPIVAVVGLGVGFVGLIGWAGWEVWRGWRRQVRFELEAGGLLVVGLAFWVTFAYSMNQSPDRLPVGLTADSVHHYVLSDYIRTYHALPLKASPAERARLVEMVTYPPAFHLTAALISETSQTDLAYTLFGLAAFMMAVCSAAMAALAYTLLKPSCLRSPLALLSAYLAYLAYGFFFDSFMYWDFYGQVAGQAALALSLYFALHYYKSGYWPSLVLGGLAGAVLVLAYTHWLPIAGLALVAAALAQTGRSWRGRLLGMGVVGGWLVLMAGLFLKDRLAGGVVWSGGAGADIAVREDGLGWLTFGAVGVVGLATGVGWWLGRRFKVVRGYSRLLWLVGGGVLVGVGAYVLYRVGSDLASVSPARLYPFDSSVVWLTVGAGLGAVVALVSRPPSRFYLLIVGGLVLEIAGYLLVKPGGSANAYHLSKLYTVGLVILLPVLDGLLAEAVTVELPHLIASRLVGERTTAPKALRWIAAGVGGLLAVGLALVAYNELTIKSPERERVTVSPALVSLSDQIRQKGLDRGSVELSVQAGIPAYFTYVGLLDQSRNDTATAYYQGQRHSFETWLYNPQAQPYLLTDEYDLIRRQHPDESRFQPVYTEGDKVALLSRSPNYLAELTDRRVLFLKFQGQLESQVLTVNLEVAGVKEVLGILTPTLVVGPYQPATASLLTTPLASRPMSLSKPEAAYSLQKGYLKWRFGDGYSRGEMDGHDLGTQPLGLGAGRYSLWLQLWKDGLPVSQRKVQDFEIGPARLTALPPGGGEPAQANRVGQLLLEAPTAAPTTLKEANTFFQQGDQKLVQITGWGVAAEARPGQTLEVWQRYLPVADLKTGYVVFAHLLDAKGAVVAQSDFEPAQGLYPTWLWPKDKPVLFSQSVKLPVGLPAGVYSLEVGIYSEPGQKRLETWFYEPYLNRIWENHFLVKDVVTIK